MGNTPNRFLKISRILASTSIFAFILLIAQELMGGGSNFIGAILGLIAILSNIVGLISAAISFFKEDKKAVIRFLILHSLMLSAYVFTFLASLVRYGVKGTFGLH